MKLLQLFLTSFFIPSLCSAIVVVTPHDIGEKPGFSGELAATLSASRGNSDTARSILSGVGHYDTNEYLATLSGSYTYGESRGNTDTDKTYIHARTYLPLGDNKNFGNEFFAQYERDLFKSLEEREILGTGVRQKFGNEKLNRLYLGAGIMGVTQKEKEIGQATYAAFNFYVNHVTTWDIKKKFVATLYYQPKVDRPEDYRSTGSLSFDLPLLGDLFLSAVASMQYDSRPADGVKALDSTVMSVLKYIF